MTEHRQGCPANGGYGHGVEPCACGADALKPEYPPLPPRACIVTNMGDDLPQRFMLNTRDGVKLMELPPGSTLDLYTADQMHAYATAALAQKDGEIAALKGLLRDAREWVEVGAHYEHDDSDARELMRAIDAALSTPPTPPSAPAGPVINVEVRGTHERLAVVGWYGDTVYVHAAPAGAGEGERKPVAFRLKHDKLGGGWRYFEGELGREPADGEQHELLFTSAPPSHEGEDARDAALTKVREHFARNGDLLFWGSAVVSWIDAIDAALRSQPMGRGE